PAKVRVLVAQGVERVGIAGDDAIELTPRQRLDVGLGEHLEQPLLTYAPHVVARVALAVVEDPEGDSGLVEKARQRTGDTLRARVERRVVADEPQHVDRLLAGVRNLELELPRPAAA